MALRVRLQPIVNAVFVEVMSRVHLYDNDVYVAAHRLAVGRKLSIDEVKAVKRAVRQRLSQLSTEITRTD